MEITRTRKSATSCNCALVTTLYIALQYVATIMTRFRAALVKNKKDEEADEFFKNVQNEGMRVSLICS